MSKDDKKKSSKSEKKNTKMSDQEMLNTVTDIFGMNSFDVKPKHNKQKASSRKGRDQKSASAPSESSWNKAVKSTTTTKTTPKIAAMRAAKQIGFTVQGMMKPSSSGEFKKASTPAVQRGNVKAGKHRDDNGHSR